MAELGPAQWDDVRRLFGAALELPEEQRAVFLQGIEDEPVRQEVRGLLDRLKTGETLREDPQAGSDERLVGTRIGHYRIESVVGHGGMGAVYRAARDDGEFQQTVAIKLVRAAAQSPETLQRFRQERQILARLAHRNIARLLDGGSTGDGVPFLVMEFIEGESITDWCGRQKLSIDARLRLFLDVCDAMDFAHRSGVLHRDLKPGNMMVTGAGEPKLIDFGIAKMVSGEGTQAESTVAGPRMMTFEYASPEQVMGERLTAASDVYALGLCLYELLTGKRAQDITDRSPATVRHTVCEAEPLPPAKLRPELAGDIDNIIRKAIRKEPERRYASAGELGGDIRRHLTGKPVTARPDTVGYRASKFIRRNRALSAAAAVAILLAGAGAIYRQARPRLPRVLRVNQLTQSGHVVRERGIAADDKFVYFVEGTPGQERVARVPVGGDAAQNLYGPYQQVYVDDVASDGALLLRIGDRAESVREETKPLWLGTANGGPLKRVGGVEARCAAFSSDAGKIDVCGQRSLSEVNRDGSGLRKVLDAAGLIGNLRRSPASLGSVFRFGVWKEGRHQIALWEAASGGGNPHTLFDDWFKSAKPGSIDGGVWGQGGKYYFFRSWTGNGYDIWATRRRPGWLGGEESAPVLIHSTPARVDRIAASPERKNAYFVSYQERNELARLDAGRGEFRPFLPGVAARFVSFSSDGKSMVYTSTPGDVLWRSRADGSEAVRLTPPGVRVFTPSWSPDGSVVAVMAFTPGQGFNAYTVASAGGPMQQAGDGHSRFGTPHFSPDGKKLLLLSGAGPGLAVMDWQTKAITWIRDPDAFGVARWLPDGRHIVAFGEKKAMRIDAATGERSVFVEKCRSRTEYVSSDGFVYYQDLEEPGQPILRVPWRGGQPERVATAASIPQSDLTLYEFVGIDPSGAPMVSIHRNNSDIYSLDLELP